MSRCAWVAITLLLAGCSGSAEMVSYNGQYYIAGDSTCRKINNITPTRVMCYDGDDKPAGWRDALSGRDIQIYMMQQQIKAQQMQSLNQSIQQVGTSFNTSQRQDNYTAPQIVPISPLGGNQVRCITAGIYTNCRY